MSTETQGPEKPPPTVPNDALTDALDDIAGCIDQAQYHINEMRDEHAQLALDGLVSAVKYLRLAAAILGAEVGALNEVVL